MNMRGFTLVETMLYIALLAFIIGGAVAMAYHLTGSSGRISAMAVAREEGDFVMRKIGWALSSASGFSIPDAHELVVTRYGGATVNVKLNGTKVEMKEDGDFLPLTSSNVFVSDLTFTGIPAAGPGPEGIRALLTIGSTTFSMTAYLRR
ncbi:TPA: hypothetical protein DIV48_02935 [Candidatus Kaiserbacteria bacterium]|nr:MAG: hypothetical protein UY93_C0002G0315 [Parcubacteria group bacterium GW2011_GWA1_56_13]KKW46404.1 MAG: hypothetical protein UY97_C0006G0008 [Parcubacteria group bacterium GW2011_GWB1_57_6]HCR52577.1 hypothetical protein [Candidatus Kaiserbacteria bacterium]